MNDTWTDLCATDEGQHLFLCRACNGYAGVCSRRDVGYCRVCGEPCKPGRTEHRACAIEQWKIAGGAS